MAEHPGSQISNIENTQPPLPVPSNAEGHLDATSPQGNVEKDSPPTDEDVRGIFNKYKDAPKVQELVGLMLWLRSGSIEDIPNNSLVANLGHHDSTQEVAKRFLIMKEDERELLWEYDRETDKIIHQQAVAKFKEEVPWVQRLVAAESAVPNAAAVVDHPLLSAQKVGVTDQVLTHYGLVPEEIDNRTDNRTAVARGDIHARHTQLDDDPPLKREKGEAEEDMNKRNMQLRAELMMPLVWEALQSTQVRNTPPEFTELLATTTMENGELIPAWEIITKKDRRIVASISGRTIGFRISNSDSLIERYKNYWFRDLAKAMPLYEIFRINLLSSDDKMWYKFRSRLFLSGIDERDYLSVKRFGLVVHDEANDSSVTHSFGRPEAGDDPEFESKREIGEVSEGSLSGTALLHFDSGVIVDNLVPVISLTQRLSTLRQLLYPFL